MKALVCTEITNDASALEVMDVETPDPAPGEVRVRVEAASVNFPDILMCKGEYQFKPEPPFTPGMDLAGVVDAVGEGVAKFQPGARVAGGAKTGGFAQYSVLSEAALTPIPAAFSFEQAAAYPAAYLTAYVSLVRRANLQPGETLLVHGATGGVGMAAVDLGKQLGATVIATSASDEKLQKVVDYGADYALNVTQGFKDRVKALTGGKGADVIYDPVGGDVFDESTRCIAFDGRLLVIGFTSGRIAQINTNIPLIKGFSVVGVRAGEYGRRFPEKGRENMEAIWKLAAEGKTRPYICAEFPLAEATKAFDMLTSRQAVGKVLIRPNM